MPPMPAEAEAPPDLATPLTASPAASAAGAHAFEHIDCRHVGIEQVEIGKAVRQRRLVGEAGENGPRARRRAIATARSASASSLVRTQIVGRDHGLAVADEDAQPEIVTFGALGFLDRAVAHFDRERHRTHRNRIGRVGAGTLAAADQTVGEIDEGGLVEER